MGIRLACSLCLPTPSGQHRPQPPSSPGNFFPSSVLVEEIVLSSTDCGAHCPPCNTCMFLRPRHLSNSLQGLVFTRLWQRRRGEAKWPLCVALLLTGGQH